MSRSSLNIQRYQRIRVQYSFNFKLSTLNVLSQIVHHSTNRLLEVGKFVFYHIEYDLCI